MAYAFDRILNAMRGGQQDQSQPNQQSIFNQYQSPSSGGEIGPGGGAGGMSGGPQSQPQSQTANTAPTAGASQVMQRNQGRTQSPVNVGQLSGRIQGAKTNLQQEAETYLANAAAPYAVQQGDKPTLKDEDKTALRDWAFNDPKPWEQKKESPFLDKFRGGVRRVDPLDLKTDTDFADELSGVVNNAGLQRTLRSSGDAMTSAGEAALDARLLFGNRDFQNQVQSARTSYDDLSRARNEISSTYRDRAQTMADEGYKTWQGAAVDEMDSIISDLTRKATETESGLESQRVGLSDEERLLAIRKAEELRPDLKYLMRLPDSFDPFVSRNKPEDYDWRSYLADEDAAAFNNIMTALGRSDRATPMTEAFAQSAGGSIDWDQMLSSMVSDAEKRNSSMPRRENPLAGLPKQTARDIIAADEQIIADYMNSVRESPNPQVNAGAINLPGSIPDMPPAVAAAMERQARRQGTQQAPVSQDPNTIRGGQIAVGPSSGTAVAQPARPQANETRSSVVTNPTFPTIQDILRAPSRIFGR